jgi:hypothetical protein
MKPPDFHIYLISKGQAGLYRSLLSIWNLEDEPDKVTILCPEGYTDAINKSVFTVSEDTSKNGPMISIRETKSHPWQSIVMEETKNNRFHSTGFLYERDMFLPNYSQIFTFGNGPTQHTLLPYYQRRRFGNSKIVKPGSRPFVPFSSLVLSNGCREDFFKEITLSSDMEFISSSQSRLLAFKSIKPTVIVQSNLKSAFEI